MADDEVTDAYLDLLSGIQMFEELAVLLLLARARDRRMTHQQVAAETGLTDDATGVAVERLQRDGLLVSDVVGVCGLDWTDPRRSAAFELLVARHDSDRLAVLTQLSKTARGRVKTAALRAIAKDFLFGKRR